MQDSLQVPVGLICNAIGGSPTEAWIDRSLALSIFGGFVVGFVTAMVNRFLHSFLLSVRAIDIASELLLELSLPLMTFFIAEEFHVSGIIAVVVAGILKASRFKKITLLEAQVDTVTETVWHTVTFMLNGSVFVILGMELELIAEPILSNSLYNPLLLLLSVVVLTFLLFAIRFVMIAGFYFVRTRRLKKKIHKYTKDMLLLTFSGVKGTVSIATILLIPSHLEQEYPLLLFLVAGVTPVSYTHLDVYKRQKVWKDNNNQDGKRTTSVKVQILNGDKVVQEIEVSEATGWKFESKALPKYENGTEIKYTVKEVAVKEYTSTVTTDKDGKYTVTNDDNTRRKGSRHRRKGAHSSGRGASWRGRRCGCPSSTERCRDWWGW